MLGDRLEDGFDDFFCGTCAMLGHDLVDASASEHVARFVAGVEDAIAEKDKYIAGFGGVRELVIFGVIE